MKLQWFDWLIVAIPTLFVYYMAYHSRKYARSVADFLAAGRLCGRYTMAVGDIANAVSIISIAAFIEVHYRTGFALSLWNHLNYPIALIMGLTGYCFYRFRETKAMSLGQFLEMRYSRNFRIFASALRSLSEIIANSIMPAIGARFFIYFLDLPRTVDIFGLQISTFALLMLFGLFIAISIICMGGALAMIITDCIQGLIMYPIFAVFVIFILIKFDWNAEIIATMADRVEKESFLNPYDISALRDFNLFFLIVTLFSSVFHRASWIGASLSSAAKSPHEQKMASLLGHFRGALGTIFYVLVSVIIITVMNHQNFAEMANSIRYNLCSKATEELVTSSQMQNKIKENLKNTPPQKHIINKDKPMSEKDNLDTRYLNIVHKTLLAGDGTPITDKIAHDAQANKTFQQYVTLYRQQMMAFSMREILPAGLVGLFLLLMILAMISTDDSRIYSASLTVAQDVFMPFFKKTLTPYQHIWLIRWTTIGVGVIFFVASLFMAQLDYINLFVTITISMWQGGCGPVMIFGLYSRFGTTAGAWTSLLTGMFMSIGSIVLQRNWANFFYPLLQKWNIVDNIGSILNKLSSPFHPYIVWEMNPVKCPINSYEFYFITMMVTLVLYVIVSKLTCKEPFNLDRMLHRGKYNLDGENKTREPWSVKNIFKKILGITPEYSLGDKITAWVFFIYMFVYSFILVFILVLIWNKISPWDMKMWGNYFLITQLIIPAIIAVIVAVWMGYGGFKDLRQLFRDLKLRKANDLDNGQVDGNVSLADKADMEAVEKESEK